MRTGRLEIKPLSEQDKENMIDIFTNEEIGKTYMLPQFAKREDAEPLFRRILELSQSAEHYQRGIYLNGELIGFLNDVESKGEKIEMGYALHPDYWGRGYMTEAFSAVIEDLFQRGYLQVLAGAFTENVQSLRVIEKCGMKRIASEEDIGYRGKTHRCVYYAKQKS